MKKTVLVLLLCVLAACNNEKKEKDPVGDNDVVIKKDAILTSDILTTEQQQKLTPKEILDRLQKGNQDFIADRLTVRNNTERVRQASLGQFPKAVILSCLDSRVPVEDVFHSGLGNLFVARVAGNIVNEDILGSLEFGTRVSGAKVIVVLGHEYCGAIKSAIDGVELGNITALLNKIKPPLATAKANFKGEATSSNPAFVEAVCDENVLYAIQQIRTKSPILADMEKKGELLIVGAVYDMKTGKVEYLKEK
jgi:carbonic anhydrase